MLIVLSGLPATGKTTIAKLLCRKLQATYLRIDTIEQAIISSLRNPSDLGALGYVIAYELASANLVLGNTVVADAVNPLTVIRETWRELARNAVSEIVEIEIVCSDRIEHRSRVESRETDIPGHALPTWDDVQNREYESWASACLVIDSAQVSAEGAAQIIFDCISAHSKSR
ncbi:MAG: AAA family ATPase [Burkholderiales bacterium]|nr:AAA family ATPase [Burkholderiales bacterium]